MKRLFSWLKELFYLPWMCGKCGYEGNARKDHYECPECHGTGQCPWNG